MEQTPTYRIADFSPHLFWDVKQENLDWERNKKLIVERVLQRGSRHDLQRRLNKYGKAEVRPVSKELPWIDEKDMTFVHVFFDIPYQDLKCYAKKPLTRHYCNCFTG